MSRVVPGVNDIKTVFPEFVKDWDFEKNEGLSPDNVSAHSNKRYWWKCDKGHSYDKSPDHRSRGLACPYCSGKKVLVGFNDLKTTAPQLEIDWDYTKNVDILPTDITAGSKKKIWWKCHVCGYSWCVSPNARDWGTRGCPSCSIEKRTKKYRKSILKIGKNDFVSQAPDILAEWDYEKNTDLSPSEYTIHRKEKVWWKCKHCGKSWQATISNRVVNNSGCPVCRKNKRTSFPEQAIFYYLKDAFPKAENSYTKLLKNSLTELDVFIPEKNIGVEYDGVAWHRNNSSKKRDSNKYSVCKELGIQLYRVSEFEREEKDYDRLFLRKDNSDKSLDAVIIELMDELGVINPDVNVERDRPVIMQRYITYIENKSIAIKYPEEVKYWDVDKNKGLTALMVNATSNVLYWWKCDLGHSYKAAPANRLGTGNGCPYCSGRRALKGFNDLKTKYKDIACQWDYDLNYPLTPDDVTPGSQKKVWWKCDKGHSYQSVILNKVSTNSGCPYCTNNLTLTGFNDLKTRRPDLVDEWDYDKNSINPKEENESSGKRVWWKCKNGHSWNQSINIRAKGSGCPYCSNNKVYPGFNDLLSIRKDLAAEWDYEKNKDLRPENVLVGSPKKVWWICDNGHSYLSSIASRTGSNTGCPYCTNQRFATGYNDLKTLYPEVAKEWNYEKNGDLLPENTLAGGKKKVWWKCSKGHEWEAVVSSRINGRGCPYCSNKKLLLGYNDFATVYPELLSEWDYEKNGDLKPEEISCGSMTKIWWKCSKGHEWLLSPNQRRRSDGTMSQCIYCAGKRAIPGETDLATTRPDLVKEWNYEKNKDIKPSDVKEFSAKKVWWKCLKCGFEWKATVANRAGGTGCPNCVERGTARRKKVCKIETGEIYNSVREAAEENCCDRNLISECCRGKRDKTLGFHWKYV